MGKRKHAFIDKELDEAVEKFQTIGDFDSKVDASERMGEVFNAALDELGDTVRSELETELGEEGKREGERRSEDFGIEHDLLGF